MRRGEEARLGAQLCLEKLDRHLGGTDVFQQKSARYRAVEPSSGSNVIPRRACPDLACLRPHTWCDAVKKPGSERSAASRSLIAPVTQNIIQLYQRISQLVDSNINEGICQPEALPTRGLVNQRTRQPEDQSTGGSVNSSSSQAQRRGLPPGGGSRLRTRTLVNSNIDQRICQLEHQLER